MAMRDIASILPLSVEGLSFEADGKRLLDSVSFTLPKGGVTAVIGPNGAGKSLTLRLCHGLLVPCAGAIRWQAETGRRRHAMVFQRPVMLRRSARANIVHALAAVGMTEAASRADAALARFGLAALADRPARLMSGGEQQRLAIARAWALEPEVLFLDEPSSQLDPGATRQIEEIIQSLASEGMTILMTTHDLGQARRLSQRILFLDRGRLIDDAPTQAVFAGQSSNAARAFIAGDLLW
ncbi:MAG: ATP-binding cassette domain-containing protein [Beijerinckiaceae bacterium]|jgi:tungstate transport system ATP-binding protein|nr:ATP-binding cassette domain-containing protein [Beijerinckiaceae bacterium]